jgi:hypothetical protein
MSDIIIQDNFLNKEYFKELQDLVLAGDFTWFRSSIDCIGDPDDYQMCHVVYAGAPYYEINSNFYHNLHPLFEKLDLYSLQRVKINLQQRAEKITEQGMHIDVNDAPENALTSILYMNTNNGYTKLESGEKIASVENRLLTFPNNLRHAGTTNSCDEKYRCVMNIDWIKKWRNSND